ncbi:MAG: HAD family hydrolase [Dehalococcoidales bacterium]
MKNLEPTRKPAGVIFDFGDTVMGGPFDPLAGDIKLLEFTTSVPHPTAREVQLVADEINREIDRIRIESMVEFNCQSFHRLLYDKLGILFSISYEEMEKEFWRAATCYKPLEGIREVLDLLAANHIKAGILSNTSFSGALLAEDLAKHDLAHRFSFVISSADYGFRKPSRRIFDVAVKKMALPPEDIWFAGDMLDYDIAGAIRAGLFPVWYNAKNAPGRDGLDCFEVRDWLELRHKIEMLCRNQ